MPVSRSSRSSRARCLVMGWQGCVRLRFFTLHAGRRFARFMLKPVGTRHSADTSCVPDVCLLSYVYLGGQFVAESALRRCSEPQAKVSHVDSDRRTWTSLTPFPDVQTILLDSGTCTTEQCLFRERCSRSFSVLCHILLGMVRSILGCDAL